MSDDAICADRHLIEGRCRVAVADGDRCLIQTSRWADTQCVDSMTMFERSEPRLINRAATVGPRFREFIKLLTSPAEPGFEENIILLIFVSELEQLMGSINEEIEHSSEND